MLFKSIFNKTLPNFTEIEKYVFVHGNPQYEAQMNKSMKVRLKLKEISVNVILSLEFLLFPSLFLQHKTVILLYRETLINYQY